jgi:hypothetical protein
VRIAAGDSMLAQIYGKPKQLTEAKQEVIVVVSRLDEALRRADLAERSAPNGEVLDYDELQADGSTSDRPQLRAVSSDEH